jgi:hypothetical protein
MKYFMEESHRNFSESTQFADQRSTVSKSRSTSSSGMGTSRPLVQRDAALRLPPV